MVKFDATDCIGFADVQIVLKKVDARGPVEIVQQDALSVCLAIHICISRQNGDF